MTNFFSRKKNKDIEVKVIQEKTGVNTINNKLALYLHPTIEGTISKFQKEYIMEEFQQLPAYTEEKIDVVTTYFYNNNDNIEVGLYIRNASNRKIKFEQIPFNIKTADGRVLLNEVFDLREIGEIPPYSAMPWKLHFNKKRLDNFTSTDGWQLELGELQLVPPSLDITLEGMPDELDELQRLELEKHIKQLPPIRNNQFVITKFMAQYLDDGSISLFLIFRNGFGETMKFEHITITLKDLLGNVIASGNFSGEGFTVNYKSAYVSCFSFNSEVVKIKDADLENCDFEIAT